VTLRRITGRATCPHAKPFAVPEAIPVTRCGRARSLRRRGGCAGPAIGFRLVNPTICIFTGSSLAERAKPSVVGSPVSEPTASTDIANMPASREVFKPASTRGGGFGHRPDQPSTDGRGLPAIRGSRPATPTAPGRAQVGSPDGEGTDRTALACNSAMVLQPRLAPTSDEPAFPRPTGSRSVDTDVTGRRFRRHVFDHLADLANLGAWASRWWALADHSRKRLQLLRHPCRTASNTLNRRPAPGLDGRSFRLEPTPPRPRRSRSC